MSPAYSETAEYEIPSAENLVSAIDSLLEALERDVDDLEMIPNFEDGVLGVRRDANSLAVVAMVLATSDYNTPEKFAAIELVRISSALANAKSVDDVKSLYKLVVDARSKQNSTKTVEPSKVASLRPLMKNALPSLSTHVKRLSRNEKTFLRGSNAKKVIDDSTIMFSIAYGCQFNVDETLAPTEEKIWLDYCNRLAIASLEFNKQANAVADKKGSFDSLKAAFGAIEETCSSTCHEKFGGNSAE